MMPSVFRIPPALEVDAAALRRDTLRPRFFGDECWKFQWRLRLTEYYDRKQGVVSKLLFAWHRYWLHRYSVMLGFSIPLHIFGPGLQIMHRGTIVINDKAKIGSHCRIHVGVNIGGGPDDTAPVIGNNVYIGPGAKIFGKIVVADHITIGANSVVNKSFPSPGVRIAGVPARVIGGSSESSEQ